MSSNKLYTKSDAPYVCPALREIDEWGIKTVDLVHPPRRFWADQRRQEVLVEEGLDARRLTPRPTPAELLRSLPPEDNWLSHGRRSINRLHAHYLICEDPQRRMDVREVETLAHQVSLVRHVLQDDGLKRVLIGDEVGLGKTVEVGLILRELLAQRPGLRVLYLAPARLVSNVRREFERLNLAFRQWSSFDGDARLTDSRVIASIHRAVHGSNFDLVVGAQPWDVLVVDECHHLSAWSPEGYDPSEAYRLVRELSARQPDDGRLILMSGTPHQGHETRFDNLLRFLREDGDPKERLAGRVIYRTKDDIVDWDDRPVFPRRQVNDPLVIDLGPEHRLWLQNIHDFYKPPRDAYRMGSAKRRAAGWRCAQALQWATSSPHAGLGYLVRQAIRGGWEPGNPALAEALAALRPYRLGPEDEPIGRLFERIRKEVSRQQQEADVEDIEEALDGGEEDWLAGRGLEDLLVEGTTLVDKAGDEKWQKIDEGVLREVGSEKVVLFAQPIETVGALARYLRRITGRMPALIVGGQSDAERTKEVEAFRRADGPQFLVSSRAGGEGINLQAARRLVHIDVPWNPMDLEQRVGRVHRFGSRQTVIVDTVVVKDSREADAYRIAREKLRLITSTMVERDRFESVFSRVMCLLPQDELQSVLLNAPVTPFDAGDESRLAEMVQEGFRAWKSFHDRYGEQQKSIRRQNPGLLTWDDVFFFLENLGGAKRLEGHSRQRFERKGDEVVQATEDAAVLSLPDGSSYVCGETGEDLVYGPDGSITPKLGLNVKPVAELIRKHALPEQPCGAAYLRWPTGEEPPPHLGTKPFGVCVLLRQTLGRDRMSGWLEQGYAIHCFTTRDGSGGEVTGEDKARLLRGLFRATVRKTAEPAEGLVQELEVLEREITTGLQRPTEEELAGQVRHAVTPLFCAIING